jgi:hypothetical protein
MKRTVLFTAALLLSSSLLAQESAARPQAARPEPQTLAARTAQLQRRDGFLPFYYDARRGELLLELSPAALEREFLYFTGLGSGVGSIEMFADRSSFGAAAMCYFRRAGSRVLVIQRNESFRADNGSPDLQRSVDLSFPTSVLVALPIDAEQNGTLLVNANALIVRDAFGLLDQLRRPSRAAGGVVSRAAAPANAAQWRLDEQRSAVDMDHTRAFPLNTELEGLLTFTSEGEGNYNQPNPHALTVREHHSLVALPEPGFQPREYDPRVGFIARGTFWDFAQRFDQPPTRRLITRWRLQKKDPNAAMSEPVKPIVFYLDRAIPGPIRSAARRGALWWNDAFAQAGFKDALRIEDLPADADPMDVRYPTIQWTNRSGRGWSVGQSHVDPRTGEIVHSVVQLDSHRMRTVHNYWAATLGSRSGAASDQDAFDLFAPLDAADPQLSEEQVMLNRIALLTCHEMGHVLGLDHNFVASTFGRGSVMDYYAPRIAIRADGSPDLSDAYMQGVGSYDKLAIEWGYSAGASAAQEKQRLDGIVQRGIQQGIVYGNYDDPRWNSYDDGTDPVTWLRQVLPVRKALLARYGEQDVRAGEEWAALTSRLPLVYSFHQYGLGSAVNVIGSARIPQAIKGDGQTPITPWPAAAQREALQLVTSQLAPAALDVRPELWKLLAPPVNGSFDTERFRSSADYLFNPADGARFVAEIVVGGLLNPQRIERLLVIQHADAAQLGARDVVSALVNAAFAHPATAATAREPVDLAGIVQTELAERLMRLAVDDNATPEAQAIGWFGVDVFEKAMRANQGASPGTLALLRVAREIELFRRDPKNNVPKARPSGAPTGPPI